jgi:cyclopropane fatty-acyl-phospholipid synthase-like methyltransferase
MAEVNLLGTVPKIVRDASARVKDKAVNRAAALKFGFEYFDGPREQGYGGYIYDGRWIKVANSIVDHFGLRPGMRVLDVGCAKGFLVKDLADRMSGLEVYGLDISEYALSHAHPDARAKLLRGTAECLPFGEGGFDLVLSINTIHNLDRAGCIRALREMERVAPGRGFVQVDAYRTDAEKVVFEEWMLTAKTYLTPEGWLDLFQEASYKGDWYWTILELDPAYTLSGLGGK